MAYVAVILVVLIGATSAHKKVDPVEFLYKYKYLKTGRAGGNDLENAIKAAQSYGHIPVTGKLDEATITLMNSPRCGVADHQAAAFSGKWQKKDLTYRFENFSPDLGEHATRRIIRDALQVWADVTPLTFTEVTGRSDLKIRFEGGQHGCYWGFDGPGGVLAHAFFPRDGRAHFDEAETFTDKTTKGTNLFWVAAHEFGHSLGLSHSNVYEALMYPYYKGYEPNFKLPRDDTQRIQRLYGGVTPPQPTPPQPTKGPDCEDDQVHNTNCKYYVANGYCKSHPVQMRFYCKKSCNFC